VVLRLNKKTASIRTDDGQRWNVYPGFLSPLAGRPGIPAPDTPER
jgi:hypothetical protein